MSSGRSKFKVGDKVVCVRATYPLKHGEVYTVAAVDVDRVDIVHEPLIVLSELEAGNCGWYESRFAFKPECAETTPSDKTDNTKTGGSTPNQYRLSVNLPLTSDRTQFVDVDLEALDVIDALDLSGNLKDVQKALFRMGKKDGVSDAYDLNKCLFYILREMKKREIVSHGKFWEVSEMLDKMLNNQTVGEE